MNVSRPTTIDPLLHLPDAAERAAAHRPGSAGTATEPGVQGRREEEVAPHGADPDVWRVLSQRERDQLGRVAAMGPLTYGYLINSERTDMPVVRGGRIDVRA